MLTLGVDAMGGDLGSHLIFEGLKEALKRHSDVSFKVYCGCSDKTQAEQILNAYTNRIELIACPQFVEMTDNPIDVVRHKKQSSLACVLRAAKEQEVAGAFSLGNTGAIVALARQILGTLPEVHRPALASHLPTNNKPLLTLDLGANPDAQERQLCEFANLGVAWYRSYGLRSPKVALLNIASEPNKGPERVRYAAASLAEFMPDLFVGFCEADEMWKGDIDILVADGFAGNIALKSAEGIRRMIKSKWKQQLEQRHPDGLMNSLLPKKLSKTLYPWPKNHAGALLLGVQGLVVKTHGASRLNAISSALDYFIGQAKKYDAQRFVDEFLCLQKNKDAII